jgi:hypothetical protein
MQMLALAKGLVATACSVSWNADATTRPTAPAFSPGRALLTATIQLGRRHLRRQTKHLQEGHADTNSFTPADGQIDKTLFCLY